MESGEKDAESSKGDAKKSDMEVKSVGGWVVGDVCSGCGLLKLLFAAGVVVVYNCASGAGSKKTFRVIWWVVSGRRCDWGLFNAQPMFLRQRRRWQR